MKLINTIPSGYSPIIKYFILIALLINCRSTICFSQPTELKFRKISREQGLSNSTIQCIYQDDKGFMWFGTSDGLNRYDGYKTIIYQNIPTDSESIKDNFIASILQDKNKNLWVSTGTGLNKFNKNHNNFKRFTNQPNNPNSISSNLINCMYRDKLSNMWFGSANGLNLLDTSGTGFLHFSNIKNGLQANNISCLFEDGDKNLWIGTAGGGLYLFDRTSKEFKIIPIKNYTNFNNTNFITALAEDGAGNLLIGTNGAGLIQLNVKTNTVKNYIRNELNTRSLSSNVIKCLLVNSKKEIWIGTENGGLNNMDILNGSFTHFENNLDNPTSLSQKTASALFEDNLGNLWVGTHRGGVNLYCMSANKFGNYTQGRGSLSFKDVKTFFEDRDGKIWIGTDGGGINIWDRKTGGFEQLRHQKGNAASIGSDAILYIMKDTKDNIWVATWGGGLNLYLGNGKFKKYLFDPANTTSISSNNVWHVYEDKQNNLWVSTSYGGLNLFNPATQKFTRIISDSSNKTQFSGINVVSANQDKYGNLWVITSDGGLNCRNEKTGLFTHYFFQDKDLLTGNQGNLTVSFIDHKQRLWVGGKGLFLFNYDNRTFSIFTKNAAVSNQIIEGITEDKNGVLWISTSDGLIAFNPETNAVIKYSTTEGLQGLEYNQNACLRLADGEMLFGGVNGFNIFDPLSLSAVEISSPVYITDFQIFNKSIEFGQPGSPLQSPIGEAQEIKLKYRQSLFSLDYSALEYSAPGATQYAYKLDGFDKNWNYVGTQHKATFTNLDPGEYIFHVKAATQSGLWNNKAASIKIIILPPFWMTWWFRILVSALIAGIFYALFFYHRKYESKKLDEQKTREIQQMQLQFFTNISHEFRTPLSLISGPLEMIQNEEGILPRHLHYFTMMQRNVNRLMGLISELMDFRKVEEGVLKLNVMPGNFGEFIKEIAADFEEMAIQKNIGFTINIAEQLNNIWFDHQIVEKIIINLIHNSFKFTGSGGNIKIEALETLQDYVSPYENELIVSNNYHAKKQVYIKISDTGRGISKESIRYLFERYYRITQEHLGSGVGLAFVKSLTRLHKGAINVYSQLNKGTEIIITLPCTKDDYNNDEKWMGQIPEGSVQLESIRYKSEFQQMDLDSPPVKVCNKAKHILIVDDNEELRNFLGESLGSLYTILTAENGREGLKKAKTETPDLIISDVMMPFMDGIEFCREVKDDIEISHIPFILLTAKNALQARVDGIGGGADYYFSKPVSMTLLQLTIKNLFEQRQKLTERHVNDQHIEIRDLVHSVKDKAFINTMLELMEQQIENTDLNVDYICHQIGMSRTKLYKKIKDLTGQTINEFVRIFRLKKAVEIMTNEDIPVMEVMYRIGIQSHSHFTTSFKKEFGKTPSQFMLEMEAKRKSKEPKNSNKN